MEIDSDLRTLIVISFFIWSCWKGKLFDMGFVWDQAFIYINHIVFLLIVFYKLHIFFFCCWFLLQRDNEDEELCSVFVPTNHLYIGDIFLVNSKEIIRPNLSIREGIGMSSVSWCSLYFVVLITVLLNNQCTVYSL